MGLTETEIMHIIRRCFKNIKITVNYLTKTATILLPFFLLYAVLLVFFWFQRQDSIYFKSLSSNQLRPNSNTVLQLTSNR